MNKEIQQVVILAGGQAALARKLSALVIDAKVTQSHVWNWINRDKKIPADYIIPICKVIGWQKTPYELAPNLYPNPGDGLPPGIPAYTEKKEEAA